MVEHYAICKFLFFNLFYQTTLISPSDRHVGGTRSKVYEFAAERSREDRYTFSTHGVICKHYRYCRVWWSLHYHQGQVCSVKFFKIIYDLVCLCLDTVRQTALLSVLSSIRIWPGCQVSLTPPPGRSIATLYRPMAHTTFARLTHTHTILYFTNKYLFVLTTLYFISGSPWGATQATHSCTYLFVNIEWAVLREGTCITLTCKLYIWTNSICTQTHLLLQYKLLLFYFI